MKNILMLLGIVIININALAQTNLNAVIEFEESTIDYGTIEKGADGVRIFKFINSDILIPVA